MGYKKADELFPYLQKKPAGPKNRRTRLSTLAKTRTNQSHVFRLRSIPLYKNKIRANNRRYGEAHNYKGSGFWLAGEGGIVISI